MALKIVHGCLPGVSVSWKVPISWWQQRAPYEQATEFEQGWMIAYIKVFFLCNSSRSYGVQCHNSDACIEVVDERETDKSVIC